MLANSFDVYSQNATYCKENGTTFEMPTKTGTYPMIRPEYNVMKNEYSNILKHSSKFGLNPADRSKIFGMKKKEKKKSLNDGLE
jgi:P27 family predicted phage terminase small subunit